MEGILPLPLQGLQGERCLQRHLFGCEVGCCDHPAQQRQQLLGILQRAAKTDQQAVFIGFAAESSTSALHQVGHLQMVERTASPTENCRQQLMAAPLAGGIGSTSPGQQQLGGHHTRGRHPLQQDLRHGHQPAAPGVATRVQACWGCSIGINSALRRSSVQAWRCCNGCSRSCGRFQSVWLAAMAAT